MRGDAGGAKFANRAIKVLGMTVRKRQDRAFAAECIGNGAADTACPARHEHMLAFQTIGHVSLMSAAPGRCKAQRDAPLSRAELRHGTRVMSLT